MAFHASRVRRPRLPALPAFQASGLLQLLRLVPRPRPSHCRPPAPVPALVCTLTSVPSILLLSVSALPPAPQGNEKVDEFASVTAGDRPAAAAASKEGGPGLVVTKPRFWTLEGTF